jgi:hypothetical protein
LVAPISIVEFANKLKKSGDKEEWKTGRSLEPKLRTYVPVLVRGAEHEGVKFWGMGKQVYQEILSIIADADYGDITDLRAGRDIVVEFKTAEETGKSFPETTIRVKPNQTPAFDPADAAIKEKVKNQKNVTELFLNSPMKNLLRSWTLGSTLHKKRLKMVRPLLPPLLLKQNLPMLLLHPRVLQLRLRSRLLPIPRLLPTNSTICSTRKLNGVVE